MAKKRSFNEAMEEGGRKTKNINVTFSKRRKGLLNKAFDLCYYYDAQVALVVLSPTGNPFAFGHSSVDDVLRRFLGGQTTPMVGRFVAEERRRQTERLERLKRRIKELGQSREMEKVKAWIEREWGSCGTTTGELELLKGKYLSLLENIRNRLSFSGKEGKVDVDDVCRPAAAVGSSSDMSYLGEQSGASCADFGVTSIGKSLHLTDVCPLSVVSSPNDMSVEKLGASCSYVGTDSVDANVKSGFRFGSSSSFFGEEETVDLIDVRPLCVANDMPYSVEKLGHTMEKRLGIGVSSRSFGEGNGGVGPFNYNVTFDRPGEETCTTFFPQIDGAYVSPLSMMDDMSFSAETVGTSCANSCTDYVDSGFEESLGITSSSSLFGDGVGPFNDYVDFDSAGMEAYTTLFSQIGGRVCPSAVMDSPNDVSYAVEMSGANCSPSGTDSVGDGDGSVFPFVGGGGVGDTENDMPLMEYSDTNYSNGVVEISDDAIFDYLGRGNFELLSE